MSGRGRGRGRAPKERARKRKLSTPDEQYDPFEFTEDDEIDAASAPPVTITYKRKRPPPVHSLPMGIPHAESQQYRSEGDRLREKREGKQRVDDDSSAHDKEADIVVTTRIESGDEADTARIESDDEAVTTRIECGDEPDTTRIESGDEPDTTRIECGNEADTTLIESDDEADTTRIESDDEADTTRIESDDEADTTRIESGDEADIEDAQEDDRSEDTDSVGSSKLRIEIQYSETRKEKEKPPPNSWIRNGKRVVVLTEENVHHYNLTHLRRFCEALGKTKTGKKDVVITRLMGKPIEKTLQEEILMRKMIEEFEKWKTPDTEVPSFRDWTPFGSGPKGVPVEEKQTELDAFMKVGGDRLIPLVMDALNQVFTKRKSLRPSNTKSGSERVQQPNTGLCHGHYNQYNKEDEWLQVDLAAVKAFLGLWIQFGLHPRPALNDHWMTGQKKGTQTDEVQPDEAADPIEQTMQEISSSSSLNTSVSSCTATTSSSPVLSTPPNVSEQRPTRSVDRSEAARKQRLLEDGGVLPVNPGDYFAREEWMTIFRGLFHIPEETLYEIEKLFNECAAECYSPWRYVSLDELGWPFRGLSRHRTFNKDKPHKWFMKSYALVDNRHFCYRIKFCKGKLKTEKRKESGITLKLVREMANSLPTDKGAFAFACDNYYTSLEAATEVVNRGHHFVGTVRKSRPTHIWGWLHLALGLPPPRGWKDPWKRQEEIKEEKRQGNTGRGRGRGRGSGRGRSRRGRGRGRGSRGGGHGRGNLQEETMREEAPDETIGGEEREDAGDTEEENRDEGTEEEDIGRETEEGTQTEDNEDEQLMSSDGISELLTYENADCTLESNEEDEEEPTQEIDPPKEVLPSSMLENQVLRDRVSVWDLDGDGTPDFAVTSLVTGERTLYAMVWKDNATVNLCADTFGPTFVKVRRREKRLDQAKSKVIWMPAAFRFYNRTMGYCDAYDAHALRYKPPGKIHVWRRGYITFFFKYLTINAWSWFSQLPGNTKRPQRDFLLSLRTQLLEERRQQKLEDIRKTEEQRRERKREWDQKNRTSARVPKQKRRPGRPPNDS